MVIEKENPGPKKTWHCRSRTTIILKLGSLIIEHQAAQEAFRCRKTLLEDPDSDTSDCSEGIRCALRICVTFLQFRVFK